MKFIYLSFVILVAYCSAHGDLWGPDYGIELSDVKNSYTPELVGPPGDYFGMYGYGGDYYGQTDFDHPNRKGSGNGGPVVSRAKKGGGKGTGKAKGGIAKGRRK